MLDHLFSPLSIGSVTLRNRIVSTSHQTSLVHDHLPTDDLIAYHEERARGGVAMICIEATAIHHTGLLTAHTVGGYLPEIVPAYRRLAEAVHAHGTVLVVQLFDGGREVIAAPPRPPAVAPSSIPSARFKTEPRALTRREIREMLDGYRQAAAFAAEGGVDGVEVCGGFDYLPTQFLSPHANQRTDEYGGSFDNRLRFLREVCEAMREGIGGGIVGCRLTDERGSWDGNTDEELTEAASRLATDGLIDYLSLAMGASSTYLGSSFIVPPVPVEHNAIAGFVRGQAVICLVLAAFYAIGLTLAGLNFGFLIGLMTGLLSFIPFVGALTGFLVAAGSVAALADAMQRALSTDAAELTEMGRRGAARVLANHDAATEAGKLAAAIAATLGAVAGAPVPAVAPRPVLAEAR